jgi:protease I
VATEQAVRDGRLVTGQTWESHPEFYREVFACLGSKGLQATGDRLPVARRL